MTLRDFIEQEIREGHVFDFKEFYTKLKSLEWEDGAEIKPEEFEDYLNHDLKQATLHHYFGRHTYFMWYEVELLRKE